MLGGKFMKIAVCDDCSSFLKEIACLLNQYSEEYHSHIEYKMFSNSLELVTQIEKGVDYDVILLDVMLPKFDGFEVCQQVREFSDVPIIMLTAKGDDMDKILLRTAV